MTTADAFESLPKNTANYSALSPVSFLAWSAAVYPDRTALIHGELRQSWGETYSRCRRLASALAARDIKKGETVTVMAPNIPATYELHFAPAMIGAVLNALNVRLDADTLAFMLGFGESRIVFVDRAYAPVMQCAINQMDAPPTVIDIDDPVHDGDEAMIGETDYESVVAEGDADFNWQLPEDEWNAITLNFTSGTTGNPKGVVYHHRGAYLNAMTNAMVWDMPTHTVYLWTLPMFHCNGWCFPWTLAAKAGTNVCLRQIAAEPILAAIREHNVTHYCGAPIVHSMLINADRALFDGIDHTVYGLVAGAAPPAAMIEGMEKIGFSLTHVYGLTETYGPAALCAKHEDWGELSLEERVTKNARQGIRYPTQEALTVVDRETGAQVAHDGETLGELVFAGNIVMKGYLKNPAATHEAFESGWYHTGDLGVIEPDGYIRIVDRAKDVIISGGENISSLEIESVLSRHPAVAASAVVARPDDKWGETPCAFIEVHESHKVNAQDIIDYCSARMASYKCPRTVVFGPLPTTSTGKVQKYELRASAQKLNE